MSVYIYNYEEEKHPYDYFNYDDRDWLSHVELFPLCVHVSLPILTLLTNVDHFATLLCYLPVQEN